MDAQYNLGVCYFKGYGGLTRDSAEAIRLIRLAVDSGDAQAQYQLGALYFNGEGGLAVDKAEALRLFHLAANQGYEKAKSTMRDLC